MLTAVKTLRPEVVRARSAEKRYYNLRSYGYFFFLSTGREYLYIFRDI